MSLEHFPGGPDHHHSSLSTETTLASLRAGDSGVPFLQCALALDSYRSCFLRCCVELFQSSCACCGYAVLTCLWVLPTCRPHTTFLSECLYPTETPLRKQGPPCHKHPELRPVCEVHPSIGPGPLAVSCSKSPGSRLQVTNFLKLLHLIFSLSGSVPSTLQEPWILKLKSQGKALPLCCRCVPFLRLTLRQAQWPTRELGQARGNCRTKTVIGEAQVPNFCVKTPS